MNIFIKHCNGQNGHFTRFWRQNVARRIYALLSVIRQRMSPFDPFRGGGRQKGTMSPFFTVFFSMRASLSLKYQKVPVRQLQWLRIMLQVKNINLCEFVVFMFFCVYIYFQTRFLVIWIWIAANSSLGNITGLLNQFERAVNMKQAFVIKIV